MAGSSDAAAVRAVADRILALPDSFDAQTVSRACAVELHEIGCSSVYMREFEGHPQVGVFEMVTLRVPRASSPVSVRLLALTTRAAVAVHEPELRECFALPWQDIDINPHIPPEGTVSFREVFGFRTLFLQFTARSRSLTTMAFHEDIQPPSQHGR
jgi:hypothetical protein